MPALSANQICMTFSAASDMSAASQQYIFVKLGASGVLPCAAATDKPIGVLQNRPAVNEMALVCVFGETPVRAGGTDLALEAVLGTDSTARAAALTPGTSTTAFSVGRAIKIDSTNAGGLVTALVNCLNLARAA